jgi:hypothetical protein
VQTAPQQAEKSEANQPSGAFKQQQKCQSNSEIKKVSKGCLQNDGTCSNAQQRKSNGEWHRKSTRNPQTAPSGAIARSS